MGLSLLWPVKVWGGLVCFLLSVLFKVFAEVHREAGWSFISSERHMHASGRLAISDRSKALIFTLPAAR